MVAWYERHRWVQLPLGVKFLLGLGCLMVLACLVVDLLSGPDSTLSPVLISVPVLAAVGARRVWAPLAAGVLAIILVFVLARVNPSVPTVIHVSSAACVVLAAAVTSGVIALMRREEQAAARLHNITEAVQRALLRPLPSRVGRLQVAVRYAAAEPDARIGGDLYDLLETRFGVRVLLGDVRGKGFEAVEVAADVLGVFRDVARTEPSLESVATRLDGAIARRGRSEEFATAILVATSPQEDHAAVIVNCGHPPPLLRHRGGTVTELTPKTAAPPLGLCELAGDCYRLQKVPFQPGDLLLLFTDGTSEARNRQGHFYPVAERLRGIGENDPGALLDRVLDDLRSWTGGRIRDDVALMALRCTRW
ncbi:PP2C family protein-serine/threonine phosphatase [Streptomyces sp. NPDC005506]|uniref:PP2C family protein-serine/threonine phosphatase n=1 Tax=unclassified Streptomyces TaxID=2593676 RepID=UPI00367474CB